MAGSIPAIGSTPTLAEPQESTVGGASLLQQPVKALGEIGGLRIQEKGEVGRRRFRAYGDSIHEIGVYSKIVRTLLVWSA